MLSAIGLAFKYKTPGGAALCDLCDSLASFAVKAFNRKERKAIRKVRKQELSDYADDRLTLVTPAYQPAFCPLFCSSSHFCKGAK